MTYPQELAKRIFAENQYMVLATASQKGEPWVSPVTYVYDENYTLYFISRRDSRHVSNLLVRSELSVAIFDSHQEFGEGLGLQIEATAEILSLAAGIQAVSRFFTRKWLYGTLSAEEWFTTALQLHDYVICAVHPQKLWMNNPDPQTQAEEDRRIAVEL